MPKLPGNLEHAKKVSEMKNMGIRSVVISAASVITVLGFATASAGPANAETIPSVNDIVANEPVADAAESVTAVKKVSKARIAAAYKKCLLDQSRAGLAKASEAGRGTFTIPMKNAKACKKHTK